MQRHGKHTSLTERLCFLCVPCQGLILKTTGVIVELKVQLWSVNQWATETVESPLLRFVTRKCLVKTLHRNSHCWELLPSNNSKSRLRRLSMEWSVVWKSATVLQLFVVTCKWSVNLFTNPNPIYSHSKLWQYEQEYNPDTLCKQTYFINFIFILKDF
jgi:hypothetical protein